MNEIVLQQKGALRAAILKRRESLSTAQRAEFGIALSAQLQSLVEELKATRVTCYLPIRGEPDTTGFLRWADEANVETLLPSVRADGLLDWILPSGDGYVRGAFGTHEPLGEILSPLAANDADLMLVPAAAIDSSGNRLGWGRGFYDRSLASMQVRPPIFGVVYDEELVDRLPVEPHDERLTGVVTPSRTLRF